MKTCERSLPFIASVYVEWPPSVCNMGCPANFMVWFVFGITVMDDRWSATSAAATIRALVSAVPLFHVSDGPRLDAMDIEP